jgi:hypothetical protein
LCFGPAKPASLSNITEKIEFIGGSTVCTDKEKMKSFLLLGISVLLFLFTLPKPPQAVSRWVSPEQFALKEACNNNKYTAKHTCKKKCLTHKAHSSSENNTGTVADCGSPLFALLVNASASLPFQYLTFQKAKGNSLAVAYLPPPLEREPNPPRVS